MIIIINIYTIFYIIFYINLYFVFIYSYYIIKARYDSNFVDYNEHLIEDIKKKHPDCVTLEMETFGLFHLAKCISSTYKKEHESQSEDIKTENNEIKTAATTMIFANRVK